ncbi:chymotrypsin-2 [Orussus abietinus]|uniref:chymotrypsin-2 n=1 Tax=Orussus abietinus TaxID=222816 RepID=UPI0006256C74|nr:chymotrypsin-2 [Orussus abietinus]
MIGASYLICLFLFASITNGNPSSRIVNGFNAVPGQFPYMVSLRAAGTSAHYCGGNFVTTQHVITAAHCVSKRKPEDIFVVSGSISNFEGGETHGVKEIRMHEKYIGKPDSWRNDIAILKLKTPFKISALRQILVLPTRNITTENCIFSGWGRTYFPSTSLPARLQYFTLSTLKNSDCAKKWNPSAIAECHLCAAIVHNQGVCNGDSGSALVCDGEHHGIASWVNPCANGVYPDVYTRVSLYLDWIHKRILDIDH